MLTKLENTIWGEIVEGDVDAYQKLFSDYFQRLYIFARKFVNDELAKDFVQDCFFELWQNRKKVHISTSISAYLFTVVKNKCYKHYQKEKLRNSHLSEIEFKLKQVELSFYLSSEKSITEFEVRDRIQKVLDMLPPKCAEVFHESRFAGQSNKEISSKLGISIKAVEKHISRALKLFRAEFEDFSSILFTFFLAKY